MTKEEILKQAVVDNPIIKQGLVITYPAKALDVAMDEYAQQQAIAFAEWMVRCQWSPIVTSIPGPPIYAPEDSSERLTLEQLYSLFLTKK
jgi:hypothetical protein